MIAKQPSQVVIPHCVMARLRPCAAFALAARQAAPWYPAAAPTCCALCGDLPGTSAEAPEMRISPNLH